MNTPFGYVQFLTSFHVNCFKSYYTDAAHAILHPNAHQHVIATSIADGQRTYQKEAYGNRVFS